MKVGCVRALEALAPEWAALMRADVAATPFQAPACVIPWAAAYAPGRAFAITARAGGRLLGLVPAFHWRGAAMLAGTGPFDYGDGLFLTAQAAPAALSGLAAAACARGLGRIELRQLRAGSPLAQAAAPSGWRDVPAGEDIPCPVMPLEGLDGLAHRDKKFRSDLRRTIARAQRRAHVTFSRPAPEAGLAALARLHRLRWEAAGQASVLDDPLMARFLAAATPALDAAGLLRLHVLHLDGAPAAALLALSLHGAVHFYLQGADPAQRALSPGVILLAHAIRDAAAEGCTQAHFLRGTEPFKARWGACGGGTVRRTFVRAA